MDPMTSLVRAQDKKRKKSVGEMVRETPERVVEALRALAENPQEIVLSPLRDAAVAFLSAPEGGRMADASYLYAKAGSVPGVADPGQVITRQNTASVTPKEQWQRAVANTGVNALTALLPGGTVAKRAAVGGAMGAYYDPENPIAGAVTGAALGELFHQGMKGARPGLTIKDVSAEVPSPAPTPAVSAQGVAPAKSFLEGLYSRLGRAIDAAPFEKGTAEQWRAATSKNVAAGERTYSGLDAYLDQNAGKVLTRQQVAEVARQGRPQLRETVRRRELMDMTGRPDAFEARLRGERAREGPLGWGATPDEARAAAHADLQHHAGLAPDEINDAIIEIAPTEIPLVDDTKYSEWIVPGSATNYREVLLQLGDNAATTARRNTAYGLWDQYGLAQSAEADAFAALRDASEQHGQSSPQAAAAAKAYKAAQDKSQQLRKQYDEASEAVPFPFYGKHWEEPNVLGHTRLSDRVGPNGERVLFAEDMQSDLHQEGREKGYQPETPDGVPDAPFKKTPEWTELMLKRILDEGARGKYDRVVFPTGQQAAEMFRLDKTLKSLDWITKDGGQTFSLADPEGNPLAKNVPAAQLPAYVGKDVAQRIVEGRGGRNYGEYQAGTLSGDDFKVEAAGMRGYYDRMTPNTLRDYLQTLGVDAAVEPVAMFGEVPNLSVPMTPALQQRLLAGQRLWSAGAALGLPQLFRPSSDTPQDPMQQLVRQADRQRTTARRSPPTP